ncbi:MAG: tetratricopeptide repeat protein [Candidatus Coatesbacteria bacterium]|nr:tetratricopeptide repeat protein [Candidatus Coatesbacteria bacterium]
MRKEAIGLSIEGTDIKVAHIGLSHKGVILKRLEVARLPEPLGIPTQDEEIADEALDAFEEAFGEVSSSTDSPIEVGEGGEQAGEADSSSALLGILAGYNLTKAKIGVNLPEDAISFYTLSDTFAVKGRKLKRAIIEMVSPRHDGPVSPDMVEYIKSADKNLTCLICDRPPVFLDVLKEIKPFLAHNKPFIGLIDSMDTALMSLVRANHELKEEQITAIIYVGPESTRTIIMKGRDYLMMLPSIQEGANSPDLLNKVYSKMLLEQDEGGLPEITHLVLAGEGDMDEAKEFFVDKMPDAVIEAIKYGKFVGSEMEPSKVPAPLSSFALPLALARKALEPTNPSYYETDFTPEYMKESQKPFRIAWHGLMSLFIIFAMSLLLVIKGGYNLAEMEDLEEDTFNHNRLTKLAQPLLYEIDTLNAQINEYGSEIAQLALLAQDSHVWSESLQKICDLTERCDSLWLVNLSSSDDMGYILRGKSRTRDKITAFASAYQNSYLDTVSRGMIRDYRLWDFTMRVKFPDVLHPQTYLAMVKEHGKDGYGQNAHTQDNTFDLSGDMPGLAMSGQMMPGGDMQAMVSQMGMQSSDMVSSMLKTGFNLYYDQASRVANSPKLAMLKKDQLRQEAELRESLLQKKQELDEQKIAASEKSLEEQYLGPEPDGMQMEPADIFLPAPRTESEAEPDVIIPEAPKSDSRDAADSKPGVIASTAKPKPMNKQEQPTVSATQKPEEPKREKAANSPVKSDENYDRAMDLFKAGQYEQAAELFKDMVAKGGPATDCRAGYWLGHCLYGMGEFQAAIEQFKNSESCKEEGVEDGVLFMLGNCYLRLGDEQSANEKYAKLLQEYPDSRFGSIASARTRAYGK